MHCYVSTAAPQKPPAADAEPARARQRLARGRGPYIILYYIILHYIIL